LRDAALDANLIALTGCSNRDPTVNLHDWYVGICDGRVEVLWPIAARGART